MIFRSLILFLVIYYITTALLTLQGLTLKYELVCGIICFRISFICDVKDSSISEKLCTNCHENGLCLLPPNQNPLQCNVCKRFLALSHLLSRISKDVRIIRRSRVMPSMLKLQHSYSLLVNALKTLQTLGQHDAKQKIQHALAHT